MIWLTLTVIWIMIFIVHPVSTAVVTGAVLGAYALIRIIVAIVQTHRGGP